MSKRNVLISAIAGFVLEIVGAGVGAGASASAGTALYAVGALAFVVSWIMGMVKTAQLGRWGWFVEVLLLFGLGALIYGIAGPDTKKA